jgi:hypothetical protein
MGEIKFNPVRLLDCKARIDFIAQELQKYVDEAMVLVNDLGPEKQYWLMQSLKSIGASIDEINAMSGKLAKLAELYGDCESTVENIVRRLYIPVPIHFQQSASMASMPFSAEYTVSHMMPKDLYVESWVMELMYSEMNSVI